MSPRTVSITLSRTLPPAAGCGAYQANPLRLTLTMEDGEDISGAELLRAEIRAAQADSTVLAAVNTDPGDGEGPWTVDFTSAQMSQEIRDGVKSRTLWLEISALYADGRMETLAIRQITVHRTGDPTEDVPAAPAAFQTAELTQHAGYATLTIGGTTVHFPTVTPI